MSQHPSHVSHASPPTHQAQKQEISDREQTALQVPVNHFSHKDIAKRAFAMYEARGATHGLDVQDWLAASKDLLAEEQLS